MEIKPIHSERAHREALAMVETLWDAEPGTRAHDRLELLGILIEDYEEKHFAIATPDPVEAVKFYLEQNGLERSELAKVLGSRSRASEFLNRKASLSLTQIRKLNSAWHIPAEILIQPGGIGR
jgi:HTH-type transcriptional regulator/antitoxin HigA